MQNPYRKKRLKEFGWITLLGFAIAVALCPTCFLSIEGILGNWKEVLLSLIYTYILGYGCTFVLSRIEGIYSWLEHPTQKFFLHFFSLATFSFIVSAILFYVFAYLLFEGERWLTVSKTLSHAKLPAFISIGIAAFFTGASFLKNWKKEAIRAEQLEKEKIATQYESLRNQVNPHFLFNSLNALSELVYENQDLAVKYIRQLSEVYRYVLDSRSLEVASLRDELHFLDSFIFLQKIRFGDNLNVFIGLKRNDVDFILPLSLQILLENAIKHNIISQEDPLHVELFREGNYLVVLNKVSRKKSVSPGTGIGLQNIGMRYKYLTENPVIIDDTQGQFIVKIPILTEQA